MKLNILWLLVIFLMVCMVLMESSTQWNEKKLKAIIDEDRDYFISQQLNRDDATFQLMKEIMPSCLIGQKTH